MGIGRARVAVLGLSLALAACSSAAQSTISPTVAPASPSSVASSAGPAPSPTQPVAALAGRLVFDEFAGGTEGHWQGTFIADPDGRNEHQLTIPVRSDGGLAAVWSPDGRRLLVNVWTPPSGPGLPGIINADGTGFHLLKPAGLSDFGCSAWSPDVTTLLCSTNSQPHARDGIYSLRADGTHLIQLTTSPFFNTVGSAGECGDSRGAFAPDGKTFAFIRQKCGAGPDPSTYETGAILIANIDGTGLREVVSQGGVLTHPGSQLSWSPDGQWIAFGSPSGQLRLVHPDGSGAISVNVGTVADAFGPSWSPDQTRIAFSVGDPPGAMDTVAPDGSTLAKVSGVGNGEAFVNWGVAAGP